MNSVTPNRILVLATHLLVSCIFAKDSDVVPTGGDDNGPRMAPEHGDVGPLAAGPKDGVRALEPVEAVRESAAKGQSISLPVGGAEANRSMPSALH